MLLRVLEIFGAQVNGGGGNCFAEFGEPWQKLTDPPTAPTACADLDVTKWFVHRRIVVAALHRSAATPTRENLSATVWREPCALSPFHRRDEDALHCRLAGMGLQTKTPQNPHTLPTHRARRLPSCKQCRQFSQNKFYLRLKLRLAAKDEPVFGEVVVMTIEAPVFRRHGEHACAGDLAPIGAVAFHQRLLCCSNDRHRVVGTARRAVRIRFATTARSASAPYPDETQSANEPIGSHAGRTMGGRSSAFCRFFGSELLRAAISNMCSSNQLSFSRCPHREKSVLNIHS